jgi:hypothetical protein
MRQLRLLCALFLIGLVCAAPALAARSVTPVELGNVPHYSLDLGTGITSADCRLGNLNGPAYFIDGWFTGDEAYKFLFHPQQTDACACPYGFQITNVHMYMYFPPGAVTCPLTMWVDLEDAAWAAEPHCWTPGVEDCASPVYQVTVPAAGLYDISIPMTCGCAFMDYWYLISVHFGPVSCATLPAIVVDAGPIQTCTNWNDWGIGWQDLADYGFTWNLAMYADASCCQSPVKTEQSTWGSVKSLYK